jgi:cobalamin-dependent methionine synthase I
VRKQLNQIFLPMMIGAGLDAVICDPLDRRLMANLVAAETLSGRDESCRGYIAAHRDGRLKLE